MKFIIISGGVISGLGKGVTASSLALLLQARQIKTTIIKCDMYLNIDAGTMNPLEHGEVFVTHDGLETDQDLGHYERFLNVCLNKDNYLTNGQIYQLVLKKERGLEYQGKCVEPYHHIPVEIIKHWRQAGALHQVDVVIIELGGSVGEYEGMLFYEAVRRLKQQEPTNVLLVHVGYLPKPASIGELKSKPLQQSVTALHSLSLQPDIIIGRAEKPLDQIRKQKIALASGLAVSEIISNPDVKNIYSLPLILYEQQFDKKIIIKLGLKPRPAKLESWKKMLKKAEQAKKTIKIAIIGKYHKTGDDLLEDAYVSVVESLKHSCWQLNCQPELLWLDAEELAEMEPAQIKAKLKEIQALIVPQGWGKRGNEGKIKAITYARQEKIPYLGLCYGMQMAVIEFARNILQLPQANSQEIDPNTPNPVIHLLSEQVNYLKNQQYGGTIRLGAWPCLIATNSKLAQVYQEFGSDLKAPWYKIRSAKTSSLPVLNQLIYERHRHRYEFNLKYQAQFEQAGIIFAGTSPDQKLIEAIELRDHPYFIGVQFHPEYLSRPLSPHPLFLGLINAAKNQ